MKETQDKNIKIAEYLGWKKVKIDGGSIGFKSLFAREYVKDYSDCNKNFEMPYTELKFHSDSNWQWVVLEVIAKEMNTDIADCINTLLDETPLNTKQDLFEAIYKYVEDEK